ncbi:FAD/NAD(P)-binding oxidoreductase [Sulfurimonas sp. C5]|uniref:NAD(P)/FAD-dependent oxidoreductase n=1 Tax=Sulfurimonas sp. C5 TaxID=3036947 RepID=UPI002456C0BD|nr:FAD/NAD(P)-binding oxidoreductase [Sulfurimonas sp. C5]MDH4943612.1 FAD/NAD(P)-binding oxidoreductase [Sulfurimonas sp. C5]
MSLSRRDALKVIGLSPVAAAVLFSSKPTDMNASEDVNGKILIVGGGSGAIMALSRLHRAIKNPDITIIAPNEIHIYQPGQVFVAAGEMDYDDIFLSNNDYIPKDVEWIKDEVAAFNPKNNSVTTRAGKEVKYDYMVVATGIVNRFDKIEGLTKEDIGTNGISCVYLNDLEKGTARGASEMWNWFNDLKEVAKTKRPTVVYTQPDSPIKCGGAPQKMLYLSADYLKEAGIGANYQFYTGLKTLFHLPKVAESLTEVQHRYDTIETKFSHFLQSIDVKAKTATFVHAYEKEVYDEDFDEYTKESVSEEVKVTYDFIHVVPPMSPPEAVLKSDLINGMGWLDVDQYSLQHKKYNNIFGIGDVCGIPMGKTGGSARHHGPILTDNLISVMKGKAPKEKFDGYTVCPLKTQYGKIIMAEFNYEGPKPTIPFLDIEKPRWMWWAFDLYMLKPMYKHLMLPGYF